MDRISQTIAVGIISAHMRGGKSEVDALKIFLKSFDTPNPKKIAAGATAYDKLSSSTQRKVFEYLKEFGISRADIWTVIHSPVGIEKNSGFVITSTQHKKAVRLAANILHGDDLEKAKFFFDTLHVNSRDYGEDRATRTWENQETFVRDAILSVMYAVVGEVPTRKFLRKNGVVFVNEDSKTSWSRDEVRAVITPTLGADQVETFMQGCGGDAGDVIGYKELDATCAEILGANFALAKKVMSAFGFEYAGRKVPGASASIKEAVRMRLAESVGDMIGLDRIDESVNYTVEVTDFSKTAPYSREVGRYSGVSMAKARQICKRAARRGVKMYGGDVSSSQWGSRGGDFPSEYRSATIKIGSMNESLNEVSMSTALALAKEWGFSPVRVSGSGSHVEYRLKSDKPLTQFAAKRGTALAIKVNSFDEKSFKEWLTSHI